jgi:hypothetical protein
MTTNSDSRKVDFRQNVVPRNPISCGHFSLNDMFCHDRMTHATGPLIFLIGQAVAR